MPDQCPIKCPKCGAQCDKIKGHSGRHWCPNATIGYHP